jgi:hypothetical protein
MAKSVVWSVVNPNDLMMIEYWMLIPFWRFDTAAKRKKSHVLGSSSASISLSLSLSVLVLLVLLL